MLRAILVLCLIAASQQQKLEIKEFSVPTSMELGTDAELKCRYQLDDAAFANMLTVKWWWLGEDGQRELLYQRVKANNQISKKLGINAVNGSLDTILIEHVEPKHSGTYECEVSVLVKETRQHGSLTVYSKGSGPNITFTKVADGPDEDDTSDVMITCEASDVTPQAELVIFVDKDEQTVNQTVEKDTESGFSNIVANVTLSSSNLLNKEVSCELFYKNTNITHPQYVITGKYQQDEGEQVSETPSATEEIVDKSVDPSHGNSLGKSWAVLLAVLVPAQLLIFQ